jgi:hypothetical protein
MSCLCDGFIYLRTALEYLDALLLFLFKNSHIILEIYIALWFDSPDRTKNVGLIFMRLDIKIVRIILIIELRSIYHPLDIWASAILLRAPIRFCCCWLWLGSLTSWREMRIGWVMHHLHSILCVYLFWEEASRYSSFPCILFHEPINHWRLMHRRSSSEATILLSHATGCNYLCIVRGLLIEWHWHQSLIRLHSESAAVHFLKLNLLLWDPTICLLL